MEKIFTLKEIKKIASSLLNEISHLEVNEASLICLSGDLGSGKTTLTQEIARQLGVKEKVISPTFVIMKKYSLKNKKFKHLYHIDAYRLNNCEELLKIDWINIKQNKDNLIIIEWPERVRECITGENVWVNLAHKSQDKRSIKINK
jgi:tRNA threonylcarbamoyladenosine biosynthesis protein TsaE